MRLPRESRRCSAGFVLLAIAACSSAPSGPVEKVGEAIEPIIDGVNSSPSQNFVVLLVHPVEGSANVVYECSGTLIAPNLVVTARHCVSATTDQGFTCDSNGNGSSGGAIGADFDPSSLWVFVGVTEPPNLAQSNAAAIGAQLFHDDATNLCNHDVALIGLDRSIPTPQAEIATIEFDPKPAVGDVFTAVGWGVTVNSNNGTPAIRQQRANVPISHVGPYINSDGEEVPPNEFDVGEVICEGDSGSPALDAANTVIGVASRGGNNLTPTSTNLAASCEGDETLNYYSQIGAFKDVILQAFSAMGQTPQLPSSEALGSFCETASNCASGVCAGSGTGAYCSQACSPSSVCPSGYSCDTTSEPQVCEEDPPSSGGCSVAARVPASGGGGGVLGVGLGLAAGRRALRARVRKRVKTSRTKRPASRAQP
jgi:hypothetical protein